MRPFLAITLLLLSAPFAHAQSGAGTQQPNTSSPVCPQQTPQQPNAPRPTAPRPDNRRQETPAVLLPGVYWEERTPLKIGDMAPNWSLPLASDSPLAKKGAINLDFAKWRDGKVTVLVFWAFWCDTWKDATRYFGGMHRELDERGIKLIAVAVDASQQPVARPAWASGKLFFPVVIDNKSLITTQYGVRRVPTILVIGSAGKVRATWEGLPSRKVFQKTLNR